MLPVLTLLLLLTRASRVLGQDDENLSVLEELENKVAQDIVDDVIKDIENNIDKAASPSDDNTVDSFNLPPSIDEIHKTIPGTVQGVVKHDGSYEDGLKDEIMMNRTRAILNCTSGSMKVQLVFQEPFYGLAYADFNRRSSCSVEGDGRLNYTIELPLRGCGTIQDPARTFINNVVVRFHAGLELDGDEVVTIICKYGEPFAPAPPAPVFPIVGTPPPVLESGPAPLREMEILLIICAILFLAFLLLGIGCSYYCLKKRNIRVVKKGKYPSLGPGSEVTKVSSTRSESLFEILRIPRVQTSLSGSETRLVTGYGEHSESLPSDYPSESPSSLHSEMEEVSTRRVPSLSSSSVQELVVKQATAFINDSFQQDESLSSGGPSEHMAEVATSKIVTDQSLMVAETIRPEARFDVAVRVKKRPPPEPEYIERSLSTISERDDMTDTQDEQSIVSVEPEIRPVNRLPFKHAGPPPVYAKVTRKQESTDRSSTVGSFAKGSIPDNDNWSMSEYSLHIPRRQLSVASARSLASLGTENTDTRSISEFYEDKRSQFILMPPPPRPPSELYAISRSTPDLTETDGPMAPRKTEITSHMVDDRFLNTITQTKSYEDILRHQREVIEVHRKPREPPPQWDVVIRNYPPPQFAEQLDSSGPEWEKFSETTTERTASIAPEDSESNFPSLEISPVQHPPPNWDILIRVLSPPPVEEAEVLTQEDKEKWHSIITTESNLRTLLTEATIKEDYERIVHDQRYEKIFEPKKWDVIIRVLNPPEEYRHDDTESESSIEPTHASRYRRSNSADTRSSMSSLPPLYEYQLPDMKRFPRPPDHMRSRRTSRSSLKSEMDARSMTEEMVNFSRLQHQDGSEASELPTRRFQGYPEGATHDYFDYERYYKFAPSQPSVGRQSLARSTSEVMEDWSLLQPDITRPESTKSSRSRPRKHSDVQYVDYPSTNRQRPLYIYEATEAESPTRVPEFPPHLSTFDPRATRSSPYNLATYDPKNLPQLLRLEPTIHEAIIHSDVTEVQSSSGGQQAVSREEHYSKSESHVKNWLRR